MWVGLASMNTWGVFIYEHKREEASLLPRWVHQFYPFRFGVAATIRRTLGRSETYHRRRMARVLCFYRGKDGIFFLVENKFKLPLEYVKQPEKIVLDNEKYDRTTWGVVWLTRFAKTLVPVLVLFTRMTVNWNECSVEDCVLFSKDVWVKCVLCFIHSRLYYTEVTVSL